jgi:hypothetical protein
MLIVMSILLVSAVLYAEQAFYDGFTDPNNATNHWVTTEGLASRDFGVVNGECLLNAAAVKCTKIVQGEFDWKRDFEITYRTKIATETFGPMAATGLAFQSNAAGTSSRVVIYIRKDSYTPMVQVRYSGIPGKDWAAPKNVAFNYIMGRWYSVRVSMVAGTLNVYVDGALILTDTFDYSVMQPGPIELSSYCANILFDDVALNYLIKPITEADLTAQYQVGYNLGCDDGYQNGLQIAKVNEEAKLASQYQAGYDAGYQVGYAIGYAEGYKVGYAEGNQAGLATGALQYQVGYDAGLLVGNQNGALQYQVGYDAGYQSGLQADQKDKKHHKCKHGHKHGHKHGCKDCEGCKDKDNQCKGSKDKDKCITKETCEQAKTVCSPAKVVCEPVKATCKK